MWKWEEESGECGNGRKNQGNVEMGGRIRGMWKK